MPLASDAQQDALEVFIASLSGIKWLANAGHDDDTAIVVDDLVDAWDGWNTEMLEVWRPETLRLEKLAVAELGDAALDTVFEAVSGDVDAPLQTAMARYFEMQSTDETGADRGLRPEWLDAIKRDLCWAAVEAVLGRPGFFTDLLCYYRGGRWPCAWEDGDRGKRVVLL